MALLRSLFGPLFPCSQSPARSHCHNTHSFMCWKRLCVCSCCNSGNIFGWLWLIWICKTIPEREREREGIPMTPPPTCIIILGKTHAALYADGCVRARLLIRSGFRRQFLFSSLKKSLFDIRHLPGFIVSKTCQQLAPPTTTDPRSSQKGKKIGSNVAAAAASLAQQLHATQHMYVLYYMRSFPSLDRPIWSSLPRYYQISLTH